MSQNRDRVTGPWVVLLQGMYLVATDGLHFEWNRNPADALVFPSKTAARRVVGSKGTVVKRSIGHEIERHQREASR